MTAAVRLSAAALAMLTVVAGCGGGDDEPGAASAPPASTASGEDQAAITQVAVAVVTTDNKAAAKTCRTLLTANFVKTVFKNQKLCAKPTEGEEPDDKATGASVTGIAVQGDTGEAVVADQGGSADGATGRWTFARVDGKWRVDTWSIEYLRAGYTKELENYKADDKSDPFHNAQLRECIAGHLGALDDATFTAGAYEVFRQTKKGTQFLVGHLLECGKTEVSPGVSLLRTVYEDGVRESLLKESLPAAFVDCVVAELRKGVTEAELRKSYQEESDETDPAMTAKYEQAGGECRGAVGA